MEQDELEEMHYRTQMETHWRYETEHPEHTGFKPFSIGEFHTALRRTTPDDSEVFSVKQFLSVHPVNGQVRTVPAATIIREYSIWAFHLWIDEMFATRNHTTTGIHTRVYFSNR